MTSSLFEERVANLKRKFSSCSSARHRYEKIIELGREAPPLADYHKVSQALVAGCQSQLYLRVYLQEDLIFFEAQADALIANGLAALLLEVYSGLTPEIVLKCPPTYLQELEIPASLTPSRANGLASLYLRMKQEALRFLVAQTASANP